MVEEGQLQKRIKSYAFDNKDIDARDGKLKATGAKDVSLNIVLHIVGEMRKDFPVYSDVEKGLLKSKRCVHTEDVKHMFVNCIYDWFERWLGEE